MSLSKLNQWGASFNMSAYYLKIWIQYKQLKYSPLWNSLGGVLAYGGTI